MPADSASSGSKAAQGSGQFNAVGDAIKERLGTWFSVSAGLLPQKQPAAKAAKTGDKREVSPSGNPFNQEQCVWLQEALGDTISTAVTTFGSHVDTKFQGIDWKLEASRLKVEVAKAQAKEALDAVVLLKAQLEELRGKLEARPSPSTASGSSAASVVDSGTFYPRHARVGNLGFDSPPLVFEARAKEFLKELGFGPDQYTNLAAMTGMKGGSSVELFLPDAASISTAQLVARQKKLTYHDGKIAWIDKKKPRTFFGRRALYAA